MGLRRLDDILEFFVPVGETKIVMSYNTKKTITFRNPDGQDVATLSTGQYQWSCHVPVGQDGKVWGLARGLGAINAVRIGFENFPRVPVNLGGPKLLIFTEFRDTVDYLVGKLRDWGYAVITIQGGMNMDARIHAEYDFRDYAQIMVTTEAAGRASTCSSAR
jgi:superfamily II DNA/RNA helicase